jgi:hypothetical protein
VIDRLHHSNNAIIGSAGCQARLAQQATKHELTSDNIALPFLRTCLDGFMA